MGVTETGFLAIATILIGIGGFMVTEPVLRYVGAFFIVVGLVMFLYYAGEHRRRRLEIVIKRHRISVSSAREWEWVMHLSFHNASFLLPLSITEPTLHIVREGRYMDKHPVAIFHPLLLPPRHDEEIELCFVSPGGLDGEAGDYESISLRLYGNKRLYEELIAKYSTNR